MHEESHIEDQEDKVFDSDVYKYMEEHGKETSLVWEISWTNLRLSGKILGRGDFGEVQLGEVRINDKWIAAAVKTLIGKYNSRFHLKALTVILNSKLHFFPNPKIFLYIQIELHCYKLPIQQFSRKQHIFGKRGNSLLLGINFRRRKLSKASVSSNK